MQNDGHTQSALQRDHSRTWFHGTLMKAGTRSTNVVHLATALHREAIAMELDQQPGWTSRIFKAIERWPENTSLWQEWETIYTDVANPRYRQAARAFYDDRREGMDAGAVLLWPEEEDLYSLLSILIRPTTIKAYSPLRATPCPLSIPTSDSRQGRKNEEQVCDGKRTC